jgi:hypothetical protein
MERKNNISIKKYPNSKVNRLYTLEETFFYFVCKTCPTTKLQKNFLAKIDLQIVPKSYRQHFWKKNFALSI